MNREEAMMTLEQLDRDLLALLEELGALTVHLREGRESVESGREINVRGDFEAAAGTLRTMERVASDAQATIAKWEEVAG